MSFVRASFFAAVAGLAFVTSAQAEWRDEEAGKVRVSANPTLTGTYPIRYAVRVNDLNGGVITAQSDSVIIGSFRAKEKPYGWYSYQTNERTTFNYDRPGEALRNFNDFKRATISDKASAGSLPTPMGEVDLLRFKATFDAEERSCVIWRGYIDGNRGLLTGYVCAASGEALNDQLIADVLTGVSKK
jgi:hypothetical protein